MIFSLLPNLFRFRGRTRQIIKVYDCFIAIPGVALHPNEICRDTELGFAEVVQVLDRTPELFVRLLKRPDGFTRYRLGTEASAKSSEEIRQLVADGERRETRLLYTGSLLAIAVVILIAKFTEPAL